MKIENFTFNPAELTIKPGNIPSPESKRHYHADDMQVSRKPLRAVDCTAAVERTFSFGPFLLLPTQRLLLEGEKPVRLGSRALDILIALVERPGVLLSKDELMARVWPNTVVVEANLTVHVAALRRSLGDGHGGKRCLINIPGRGYRFVAPVIVLDQQNAPTLHATGCVQNLPARVASLIGRAAGHRGRPQLGTVGP